MSRAGRISTTGRRLNSLRYVDDFPVIPVTDRWESMQIGTELTYVVQTAPTAVQRCILMTTDPGDLVLDPTCGSGTTAYVAEQWGRRWIAIDTSRVALARARIMGARYPYYILADSRDCQLKEAELSRRALSEMPTYGKVRQGFVYERVPHITLRDIANNAEIDVIWEEYQEKLEGGGGLGIAVSSYFHGFHLPTLQTNSRVVAGLLSPPWTGGVHQRWLSLEHSFPPQVSIGPKVGFVHEEDFGPYPFGLLSDLAVLDNKGFPLFILSFQEAFLGPLQHKAQPV